QCLVKLGLIQMNETLVDILNKVSFVTMLIALATGAVIILASMWKARRAAYLLEQSEATA
ncbi:MAG: hypothetical protein ACLGPL_09300, partial [Acidobacteriota bacterium]